MSVNAGHCEGVLFANELLGPLLSFTSEVAIGEMVAVKALMSSVVGAVEDDEGEARQASDMHFIGSEACRGVDRVVVGVLNVRQVCIPVILVFVAY